MEMRSPMHALRAGPRRPARTKPTRMALWAVLLALAAPAGRAPARAQEAATLPEPQVKPIAPAIYADLFPQDMNNYRVGGWRDLTGDGTGGTVTATPDNTAIYMDGTTNALAYLVRNSPDTRSFEMDVDFSIVNQQMTPDDHLVVLLRFKDPVFPAGCCFGGAGEVHAASGVAVDFGVGRGVVTPYREKNGSRGPALAPPALFNLGFGVPHTMRVSFVGVNLAVDVDGAPVGRWQVPNSLPGRIGLEAYRLDLRVTDIRLTTQ